MTLVQNAACLQIHTRLSNFIFTHDVADDGDTKNHYDVFFKFVVGAKMYVGNNTVLYQHDINSDWDSSPVTSALTFFEESLRRTDTEPSDDDAEESSDDEDDDDEAVTNAWLLHWVWNDDYSTDENSYSSDQAFDETEEQEFSLRNYYGISHSQVGQAASPPDLPPKAKRGAELASATYARFTSEEVQLFGEYVSHLLGAILCQCSIELEYKVLPERQFHELCRAKFAAGHAVWRHIDIIGEQVPF